jgi:hypothetical protein
MTDTGSFMFEGTNEHTFAIARELVLAGADPAHCARNIYFGHSTAKLRLLGAALANLHRQGDLAWIWVTQEQMERFDAREEDCEGLVNYALSIGDVQVAIFFRELPDGRWRVSLRSKGQVDVAVVAEYFGGGGHDGPLTGLILITHGHGDHTNHRQTSRGQSGGECLMNTDLAQQLISFVGALLILIAYGGHQLGWVNARGAAYNLLNASGSAILAWIAFHPFQVGFVVLEGVWTIVSLWALLRARPA